MFVVCVVLLEAGCLGNDPQLATGGDPTAPLTAVGADSTITEGMIYDVEQYMVNLSAGDTVMLRITVKRGGPPLIEISPLINSGKSDRRVGGRSPVRFTANQLGLYHIQIANVERAYITLTVR